MKQRIDRLLVDRGLVPSPAAAIAMVMADEVTVNGQPVSKAGQVFEADARIELAKRSLYVSRGGEKLASVAAALQLDFSGKVVLDVGSSTGGFTDYALQNGAAKVYSVDVGNAQLAYKLRQDPRVVVMERTDIRDAELPARADIAVIDVSFISLRKILGRVVGLLDPNGVIATLMKPQFEADKATADRYKGLILDEGVRQKIIQEFRLDISAQFEIFNEADSGVLGRRGNRERFFVLRQKT